jgi:uncharacterized protein
MRRLIIGAIALLFVAVFAVLGAGEYLSAPAHRVIGYSLTDLPITKLTIPSSNGGQIAAWQVNGSQGKGVILLLHGVRADRLEMLNRARFLYKLGYSLVLPDLPGHGESSGDRITFGSSESSGVKAVTAYIRNTFPNERIGAIGVSLGAASLVMSRPEHDFNAIVLESMFLSLEEAIEDRLRIYLGPYGGMFSPLLTLQLPLRLGIPLSSLRPIDALTTLKAPLLLASGSIDRHTTLQEAKRLFAAAASPKELWIVEGAAHVDLHVFAGSAYEERIAAFFSKHIRSVP